jgi:hypothetical protein
VLQKEGLQQCSRSLRARVRQLRSRRRCDRAGGGRRRRSKAKMGGRYWLGADAASGVTVAAPPGRNPRRRGAPVTPMLEMERPHRLLHRPMLCVVCARGMGGGGRKGELPPLPPTLLLAIRTTSCCGSSSSTRVAAGRICAGTDGRRRTWPGICLLCPSAAAELKDCQPPLSRLQAPELRRSRPAGPSRRNGAPLHRPLRCAVGLERRGRRKSATVVRPHLLFPRRCALLFLRGNGRRGHSQGRARRRTGRGKATVRGVSV